MSASHLTVWMSCLNKKLIDKNLGDAFHDIAWAIVEECLFLWNESHIYLDNKRYLIINIEYLIVVLWIRITNI